MSGLPLGFDPCTRVPCAVRPAAPAAPRAVVTRDRRPAPGGRWRPLSAARGWPASGQTSKMSKNHPYRIAYWPRYFSRQKAASDQSY